MEIPNRLLAALMIFGIVVAAVLWICGAAPWWMIPIIVVVAPIAACATLALLFYAAWLAAGNH